MSFLAPLYILGTLGLALPVLLHLIRRTPRGQLRFSSLMFLAPTPPRLTRRSRLDNLLLLLLRCAALTLLALAFARPFLREAAELILTSSRQRLITVLLDTSASMRREGLWQDAKDRVARLLSETNSADRVALLTFDEGAVVRVDFDDLGSAITAARRTDLIREQLGELQPSWAATNLGTALTGAADLLDAAADADRDAGDVELLVVLVSDLQQGSDLAALQAFEWPARVRLRVERVASADPTNAGLQTLAAAEAEIDEDEKIRLRVINDTESAVEQFRVQLTGSDPRGSAEQVYVPPGQTRVVRVPAPGDAEQAAAYRILGDAHEFDNTAWLAPRLRQHFRVVYIGRDTAEDPEGLSYYLKLALADTPLRDFDFVAISPEMSIPAGERPSLVVVADAPVEETAGQIQRLLESGGRVVLVVQDEGVRALLQRLLATEEIAVEKPPIDDYALLTEIDWKHPLFSAFSGPRYGDFTKIHFWDYWRLQLPDEAPVDVVARFDRGDIAIGERRFPNGGRLDILTSGWKPADSQLALSTKFVPFIWRLLPGNDRDWLSSYRVGREVQLPEQLVQQGQVTIQRPDGTTRRIGGGENRYSDTDLPGVYRAVAGSLEFPFAVNVAASESRTSPLEFEELEQFGVLLAGASKAETTQENERQMRDVELERQQQLWRWLIVGAIAILLAETYLAGRAARPLPAEA